MTNTPAAIRDVIEAPLRCLCGDCVDAIERILWMERDLCHAGRSELGKRRSAIRRITRQEYERRRYRKVFPQR